MVKRFVYLLPTFFLICSELYSQEYCPAENLVAIPGDSQVILEWNEPGNPFNVAFTIEITTDTWPGETSASLIYLDTGEEIWSIAEGYFTAADVTETWEFELEHGEYIFTIYDSWGDGQYDPGGYTLTLDGEVLESSYGWEGTEESIEFSTQTRNYSIYNTTFTDPLPYPKGTFISQHLLDNWPTNDQILTHQGQLNDSRDVPEECGDFQYYSIQVDGQEIGQTEGTTFTHTSLVNGNSYCYTVVVEYEGTSSLPTSEICATPSPWTAEPPSNLLSFPGDEQMTLLWMPPGGGGGGDQGDNINNPFVVTGLPFNDTGSTVGFSDDYDEECPYTGSLSPDVVYLFNAEGGSYDFSICESGYDTKIYVYDIDLNVAADGAACNDDECSNAAGDPWRSLLENIYLDAGVYYVVVDGYGSQEGDYELLIDYSGRNIYSHDNTAKFVDQSVNDNVRTEYDFLGYNVFVDNEVINVDPITSATYTVAGLNNELSYLFGVTAVYEGPGGGDNYQSVMITTEDSPIYLFGDVGGTIVDPNGDPLDSVVVSSGSISDTTSTDGVFLLMGLLPGSQSIRAQKVGFYTETADVAIIAQADPIVQDFVLSPDMPRPVGLSTIAGDQMIHLSWLTPGSMDIYELSYDDGEYELSITGGSDQIELGVYFDPNVSGEILQGRFMFTDLFDGNPTFSTDPVEVRVYKMDQDGLPELVFIGEDLLEVSDVEVWLDYDFPEPIEIDETGFILSVRFTTGSGPGICRDENGYIYGHSFVNFGDNYWLETGDLGFPGNYMMRAVASLEGEPEEGRERHLTVLSGGNQNSYILEYDENASYFEYQEQYITILPTPYNSTSNREDVLTEYKVYQVDNNANTTLVATTTDTFTTVTVAENYIEYCYNVRAVWNTDSYGTLESRASNVSCAVPFTYGDADFDSDADIQDVLSVVDYILEEEIPTEDQFRNVDLNMDEEINIADVVMIVDILFGGNSRVTSNHNYQSGDIAFLDIKNDYQNSELLIDIDNIDPIFGMQFLLEYDPNMVSIRSPIPSINQENLVVINRNKKEGEMLVVLIDMSGETIQKKHNTILRIPIEFNGHKEENSQVKIEDIKLAGFKGELINFVARTNSSDIKMIPNSFGLKQNYPNPFNPTTKINYEIPQSAFVELVVFNLIGQKVKVLNSTFQQPGYYSINWDGKNDNGVSVPSGVYFYTISSKSFQKTKKMLYLK